ncbi:MAG: preprotein translocase subunit SecY [Candidatus Heimdallarchaeota archaeon]|nr:preprotein translocase subunit SecY [Candidatus Heimdallarchaeota archaeon]MCK5048369.1 preprotein translocase subunit SecY [Candidatus Heimdallarchaeota archaeon]
MTSKILLLFKPFIPITFEIKKPEKKISFKAKIGWTLTALILYLMMLNVPLSGLPEETGQDPFFALRAILASQRGSLAELGIGPIVTAGMVFQLLVGSGIIKVNMNNPEERSLYTAGQKIMSVLMTVFEAIAYIAGGAYGDLGGLDNMILVTVQLVAAGIAIMMLDELVQKGWGLGSGISLFIASSVSFQIFFGLFDVGPGYQVGGSGNWFRGALLSFFQGIFRGNVLGTIDKPGREPDILGLLATILVFAVVIFAESMRIEVPVTHTQYRMPARYPLKLIYTSNIPVILVSALFANVYFISNLLDQQDHSGGFMALLSDFMGHWEPIEGDPNGQLQPVSGLASFTTAPFGLENVVARPLNAIVYLFLMILLSTVFSIVWVQTAGMDARSVAKQLLGANMQIPGFRRSEPVIAQYLEMYITPAAILSGIFIGTLAACADFLGAIGTGTGILLTTGIIRQYYEILAKERLADVSPALAGFLGID